jgi:CRISPR-associated protein Cas2
MHLSAYRIMWLFVFFDLPTNNKKERKDASKFRKNLLNDGFRMMQYSVYVRHCASSESADVHERRVKMFLPKLGQVSVLRITDKQYGNIQNFMGLRADPFTDIPAQLEMF